MPTLRMKFDCSAALLGILALGSIACTTTETRPTTPPLTGSASGQGGQGATGQGGGGGGVGSGGGGGMGGGGGSSAVCGNAMLDPGEPCEGADLGGKTCQSFGFDTGTLSCQSDCTFDTSGCSGTENCQDAIDNDGDSSVDCGDSDCTAACMDACAMPPLLPDPASVTGSTSGHAALADGVACASVGGPAVAYAFTAADTGFLDVQLTSNSPADLSLAVRTACTDGLTEIGCSDNVVDMGASEKLSSIPINQNDTVYIIVSGSDVAQAGPFALTARSRVPGCGDTIVDPPEECDDANTVSGDGCSSQCLVEATEVEPNDTIGTANPYTSPFYALITPGDEDVVVINVPSSPASLIASTEDITVLSCADFLQDSYIEILDDTATVLASDDDSGTGYCASAVAGGLSAGPNYVRVKASPMGSTPMFPYRLALTLIQDVCGDGMITPSEQCDDGGTVPGDGCSATCQFEISETEPNDTPASADAYASPWLANISPGGDVDYVSVNVPGPASTLTAATGDHGTGTCNANKLDSVIDILASDGTTVLATDDDSGPGYCSMASATGLAAGQYFVRVHSAPLVPTATFLYELTVTVQ